MIKFLLFAVLAGVVVLIELLREKPEQFSHKD